MKRWILSLALCLCLCLTICGLCGRAEAADVVASGNCGQSGANVTWSLDGEGTMTISGSGKMKDWSYSLARPWNSIEQPIKKLVIENGVTHIGDYAFYFQDNLTSIGIPDSVTSIGDSAFNECIHISSIYLTSIESWLSLWSEVIHVNSPREIYLNGKMLTDVIIPEGVASIGGKAFDGCTSLTSISLPDSVTSIGDSAFVDCTGLTSISLPDSVTNIGWQAFCNCTGLTSISLPDNVTSIEGGTFQGCTGLTSISIPDGVSSIKNNVFDQCTGLTSIRLPENMTSIGMQAFRDCKSLTNISIPKGVTSIGEDAFCNCTGLTSISIPDSVTSIGYSAFSGCANIGTIFFNGHAPSITQSSFREVNAIAFYPSADTTWNSQKSDYGGTLYWTSYDPAKEIIASGLCGENIIWQIDKDGVLTVKGSGVLTDVSWWSLYKAMITEAVFSDTITMTQIPDSGFAEYVHLRSITLPAGIKSIGSCAFSGCTSLKSIHIPGSVTSIGYSAFSGCESISSVYITDIDCWLRINFSLDNNPLASGAALYLNDALLTDLAIPEGYTSVPAYVFYGCSSLKRVVIPSTVTSLGECAFYGCTALERFAVAENNPAYCSDADGVLMNREKTTLYICPAQLSGGYAIPKTINRIEDDAFRNCSRLKSIAFLGAKPSIGEEAFYGVRADSYYPESLGSDVSWTQGGALAGYGGKLNWRPWYTLGNDLLCEHVLVDTVVPPSCTFGYTLHQCPCGYSYRTDFEPGAGHDLVADPAVPATCTETGLTKGSHCTRCDYKIEQEVVPALGHDYIDHEAKAASCTAVGWAAYQTCSRCDYTTYKEIPAKGHTAAAAVKEKEVAATCTKDGSYDEVVYCSACKEEMSRTSKTVHALGHDLVTDAAVAATCTESGLTKGSHCTRCDYKVEQEVVPALGHDYIDHEAKAASCTKNGWEAYQTCSRCDYTTYKEIPAKGHTAAAAVREKEVAATCTKDGSYDEVVYCSACKEELSRTSKTEHALGHALVTDPAVSATCTETGLTEGSHCARCDYKGRAGSHSGVGA